MTTWDATQTRILREASDIKLAKVALTVVAAPFFALGYALMCLWLFVTLVWQAGWVGASQARASLQRGNDAEQT